jgi:hypothetical protein
LDLTISLSSSHFIDLEVQVAFEPGLFWLFIWFLNCFFFQHHALHFSQNYLNLNYLSVPTWHSVIGKSSPSSRTNIFSSAITTLTGWFVLDLFNSSQRIMLITPKQDFLERQFLLERQFFESLLECSTSSQLGGSSGFWTWIILII